MSVPWLVVSPHCDDGVFSCGALLARHPGSVVVTVFAGSPPSSAPCTEWDRACGFLPGDDVMALRRAEDARALERLGTQPVWLPFLDRQYGSAPTPEDVARALLTAIGRWAPDRIAYPLGLFHSDHVLVREAMLALAARAALPPAVAYADALYRRIPGLLEAQVAALEQRGYAVRMRAPAATDCPPQKRMAIACYRSQLRALATPGRPGHLDAYAPEQYLDVALAKAAA